MADDTEDTPAMGAEDLGDAGKKALDAERKARREAERKLNQLTSRLAELEDRDKSEMQRVADAASEAEKRAADAELRAVRLEVAVERGLGVGAAKFLSGDTREDIEAAADELSELVPKPEPEPTRQTPPAKPVEALVPGTNRESVALGTDPLEQLLKDSLGIQ